jgi:hypothetical protein
VRSALVALLLAIVPGRSLAQSVEPPLHRLELAAGVGFLGGAALGTADADIRSGASSDPYRLFTTSSRSSDARVVDLRAGVDLTRRFGVEARAVFGHPEMRTAISSDAERAPDLTASERLDHYFIDGGIVIRLDEWRIKGVRPFVSAGGGHLRQLHEGLTVVETGRVFYVGGGARRIVMQHPRGLLRAFGVRGDVRLNVVSGGITVEDETRRQISASASLFVMF